MTPLPHEESLVSLSPVPSELIIPELFSPSPSIRHTLVSLAEIDEYLVQQMIGQLSTYQLEIAARTSYVYSKRPSEDLRLHCAKEMALRYLRSKKDPTKALEKMKSTIEFRRRMDIDSLRRVFDSEGDHQNPGGYRDSLYTELASKKLFVQGFDKDGRGTYIFVPRLVDSHDSEWTIKAHLYTLERAIATSKSEDKTVNAVVDFRGYSLKNSPPYQIGKELMLALRNHYVGRINRIFLVDAPTAFWCLWQVVKPLIGSSTRDKIQFVSSSQKENVIGEFYSRDQAAAWMLPGGTLNRELDLYEYLHKTPFECAFNE